MNQEATVGQAVEVIRLKVLAEQEIAFLDGRKKVDAFTSTLKGFVGTELVKVNGEEFLLIIRWADEASVREAQQATATASVITDWINATAQFVSFDTGISKYVHENSRLA